MKQLYVVLFAVLLTACGEDPKNNPECFDSKAGTMKQQC
jgi:hypothetical protein